MLIIRLQRVGRKNHPEFRLVLAEKHRAASKKAQEVLGQYNPRTKELQIKNQESLKTWLDRNVELSPTARNLLITKKILTGTKVQAWKPKKKEQEEKPAEAPKAEAKAEETPKQA